MVVQSASEPSLVRPWHPSKPRVKPMVHCHTSQSTLKELSEPATQARLSWTSASMPQLHCPASERISPPPSFSPSQALLEASRAASRAAAARRRTAAIERDDRVLHRLLQKSEQEHATLVHRVSERLRLDDAIRSTRSKQLCQQWRDQVFSPVQGQINEQMAAKAPGEARLAAASRISRVLGFDVLVGCTSDASRMRCGT